MKLAAFLALLIVGTAQAFSPPAFATRAVGKPAAAKKAAAPKGPSLPSLSIPDFGAPAPKTAVKKAPTKKVVAKKVIPKKAPKRVLKLKPKVKKATPVVKKRKVAAKPFAGYPSVDTSSLKFKGISGGGNSAPPTGLIVPSFADPKLQFKRDPKFYAAAAKTRSIRPTEFVYDDGLTDLERKQRSSTPLFLTGSAKSQADTSTVRGDLDGEEYAFGLDGDRFQLLFISIFGLFTLVGCLSGTIQL